MRRKKKSNTKKNLVIGLGIVALGLIIYFSVLQAFPFDNTAEHHFSFTDGEDIAEGYTLSGTDFYIDGGVGKALNFNNSDDSMSMNGYQLPTGGFTMSMWIHPRTLEGYVWNQYYTSGGYSYGGYSLLLNGYVNMALYDNGHGVSCSTPAGSIEADTWFYYTSLYNVSENTFRIYINGLEACSQALPDSPYNQGQTALSFGSRSGSYLNAWVDEVSIYHHPLTPAEILEDFNEQKEYFIKYSFEFYHHRDINITGFDDCETFYVNDLERTTFCNDVATIGETIDIELQTTRTILNPEELTDIFMDGNKYLLIESNDTQVVVTSPSSGGGGSSTPVEEELEIIEEEIIPEELSIIEQSVKQVSDGLGQVKQTVSDNFWISVSVGLAIMIISILGMIKAGWFK